MIELNIDVIISIFYGGVCVFMKENIVLLVWFD